MSAQLCSGPAKKACSRCARQKRKCDRAFPTCSLCMRLHEVCVYETTRSSVASKSTLSRYPGSKILPNIPAFTPSYIKPEIIQFLSGIQPKDVASTYFRTIENWFPIISETTLRSQLPNTWDDATVDFTLLSLTIVLLSTLPEDGGSHRDLMSLYLSTKGWNTVLEGIGINSLEVVQSRLLITLFEVSHGFNPAAYVSIGAAVSAAQALPVCGELGVLPIRFPAGDAEKTERMMTWRGILILDRYIATENGRWPPITSGRTFPDLPLSISVETSTRASSHSQQFLRLFEASTLLDRAQILLREPILQHSLIRQEMMLILRNLTSLETILHREISENLKLFSNSLSLCTIGLFLSFEIGSRLTATDDETRECRTLSVSSLDALVEVILKIVEPLREDKSAVDIRSLPPFIVYLVYKAASIVTERVRMGDESMERLQRLKLLRHVLQFMSQRWLVADRYLQLLNEETTPRILKTVE